jgi:uncharacterized protein YbjT (DUF2867 family)
MYAIMGATGKVGGGIAQRLLKEGAQVTAIGRNRDKLAPLTAKGAQAAVGDVMDAAFLARALAGSECAFLMVPPDLAAADIHAHYDRASEAMAKALKEAGVKAAVVLSSVGADLAQGNGPIAGLNRLEKKLDALAGIDLLVMRPGYFMENHYGSIGMIQAMGINGGALRGDMPMAQIATRDISGFAAKRMLGKDWKGRETAYLLGAGDLTMADATAALGKAIGKPDLKYVQFPYEDAIKGMMGAGFSASVAQAFAEMSKAFNEGIIRVPARTPANTTATGIGEFAQDFAQAYASGAGH